MSAADANKAASGSLSCRNIASDVPGVSGGAPDADATIGGAATSVGAGPLALPPADEKKIDGAEASIAGMTEALSLTKEASNLLGRRFRPSTATSGSAGGEMQP